MNKSKKKAIAIVAVSVTFDKSVTDLNLLVQSPSFIVEGDWTLIIS